MFRFLLEFRHVLVVALLFIFSTLKYTNGQQDCGIRPPPPPRNYYIAKYGVYGSDDPQFARREDFPWFVGIFRRSGKNASYKYECGGTLILGANTDLLILTAARCVSERQNSTKAESKLENIRVVIGPYSSNYNSNSHDLFSQKFAVRRIEINPLYEAKGSGPDADAAIIQVDGKIELGMYAVPACIPPYNSEKMGVIYSMVGEIAGFGWDTRRNFTESLRYARYPISISSMCQEKLGVKVNDYLEFCTGFSKDATACQADIGGGLVFQHPKNQGRYYVQGILSKLDTTPVTEEGYCENFNVFQRVGPYLEWIKNTKEKIAAEESVIKSPSRPQPTPGVPLNYIPEFAKIARDFHNHYRGMHKAPPLRLVQKIQEEAQKLAQDLVEDDSQEVPDSETSTYSTNVFTIPRFVTAQDAVREAIQYWYRGFSHYDRDDPQPSAFTQMVWKSSKQMGVGVATNGEKTVVIVQYWPKGNVILQGGNRHLRTKPFNDNVSIITQGY